MDLPLHEDDLAEPGVIDPAALHPWRPDMPEAAVLCFFPEVVDGLGGEPLLTISTERGRIPVRVMEHAGERVAVVHPGVGAPLAAMFLEDVIALGVRRVVAVGGAGSLLPDLVLGHAVVVGSAVRDEGTSFHYLPPGRVVDADPDGVAVLAATLTDAGLPHVVARAWTTDAVYRETRARVDRRRAEGCAVVEMEAAALIAVARFRGIAFAHLVFAADSLAGDAWDDRGWRFARDVRRGLFDLAVRAATRLGTPSA